MTIHTGTQGIQNFQDGSLTAILEIIISFEFQMHTITWCKYSLKVKILNQKKFPFWRSSVILVSKLFKMAAMTVTGESHVSDFLKCTMTMFIPFE